MIGLFISLGISLFVLYVIMMSIMIIFERDKPKNMILWSVVFLLTQIVGYVIYICVHNVFHKKKKALSQKEVEDDIYKSLIANNLSNVSVSLENEVFSFNELAYSAIITANNNYEFFSTVEALINTLVADLKNAKNYIFCELTQINFKNFKEIKDILIEKSQENLLVRVVHDRNLKRKYIKALRQAGVKIYRFSKHNTLGKVYSNLRNAISIDGEIAYVANLNISNAQFNAKKDIANSFMKIKGDVVREIDIQTRKDAIFSSGKFIPYEVKDRQDYKNNSIMQFISNEYNTDIELALIKAICTAKKSIQLELNGFIPSESIMSLLRFAINSNIQVRLMVPLKNNRHGKYFASRAYAKQLALYGANVYLFDGYINFNAITIDDEYVIFGSYIVDREHLNTSQQSILFIKDNKAVKNFNNLFNSGIDNSYRINNAKMLLLREKFFKNFV